MPVPCHCDSSVVVNNDIVKPKIDKNSYRGLELPNGLRVLLVSDPETEKAAVAINVHVGHLCDPVELPGLAHFCEHMLFLGTEKYPDEGSYHQFLQEHGGSCNASTAAEHTVYHFDVSENRLEEALDRLTSFFVCPLFTESATEREISAVNNENARNVKTDSRRLHRILRILSKPGNAWRKFGTGNRETLDTIPKEKGVDVRNALMTFHGEWYSSNITTATVVGKEDLNTLQKWVCDRLPQVPNKNIAVPSWTERPYGENQLGTKVCLVPVNDIRKMTVVFPFPDLTRHHESKPSSYISHLIGHEGPGSLFSLLKNSGWVNSLSAGSGSRGVFCTFTIDMSLTPDGLDNVAGIMTHIWQYIKMVRSSPLSQRTFDEIKAMKDLKFQFKEKSPPASYARHLASALHDHSFENVLTGDYLISKFDRGLISDALDVLTPDNCILRIASKTFEGTTDETEKYYGIDFKVEKMNAAEIEGWKQVELHPELHLPNQNDFIPAHLCVLKPTKAVPALPEVVLETPENRLWYKFDDKFEVPKINMKFDFVAGVAVAFGDPRDAVCNRLYVDLVTDALNEYAYAADIAGLSFQLSNTKYGLELEISGYCSKEGVLLEAIMSKMLEPAHLKPERFVILKEKYKRSLENFKGKQPCDHTSHYVNLVTSERMWTPPQKLGCLDDVTLEDVQQFSYKLFRHVFVEGFIYGNVMKEDAVNTISKVAVQLRNKMGATKLAPGQASRTRQYAIPDTPGGLKLFSHNLVHTSCAVEFYLQFGPQNLHDNTVLDLFLQIISEPCFNVLRTKEQLGYIIRRSVRRSDGVMGVKVAVQSVLDDQHVHGRMEAFLDSVEQLLEDLSTSDFSTHKEALAVKKLDPPKKLSEQGNIWWDEITTQQHFFDRNEKQVAHMRKNVTLDDVKGFYRDYIHKEGSKRRFLCVHVIPWQEGDLMPVVQDALLLNEEKTAELQTTFFKHPRCKSFYF